MRLEELRTLNQKEITQKMEHNFQKETSSSDGERTQDGFISFR